MSKRARSDSEVSNKRIKLESQDEPVEMLQTNETLEQIPPMEGKWLVCVISHDGKNSTIVLSVKPYQWRKILETSGIVIDKQIIDRINHVIQHYTDEQVYSVCFEWRDFTKLQLTVIFMNHHGFRIVERETKFGITYCIYY